MGVFEGLIFIFRAECTAVVWFPFFCFEAERFLGLVDLNFVDFVSLDKGKSSSASSSGGLIKPSISIVRKRCISFGGLIVINRNVETLRDVLPLSSKQNV